MPSNWPIIVVNKPTDQILVAFDVYIDRKFIFTFCTN